MYRLLVIDDEQIVLDSVTYIITNNFDDIIIETARNGKEGILKLESFRPHIVMTDIKMAGIDGLEFIKEARKLKSDAKIIVVSAYEYFEYARESLKFNIEDYVLKPVTKKKLVNLMNRMIEELEKEKAERNKAIEDMEKFYESIPLIENNLFNVIVFNRPFEKYLDIYRGLLGIGLNYGRVVTMEFQKLYKSKDIQEANLYNAKINECYEYYRNTIKFKQTALISPVFINKMHVYIESNPDRNDDQEQLDYWESVRKNVMEQFGLKIRISISKARPILDIHKSYEETLALLCNIHDEPVTLYSKFDDYSLELTEIFVINDKVLDAFKTTNQKFKKYLKELEKKYRLLLNEPNGMQVADNNLIELYMVMNSLTNRSKVVHEPGDVVKNYVPEFIKLRPLEKLSHFVATAETLFEDFAQSRTENYAPIIVKILEQIAEDYKSDINLEDLANQFNVTPQYLSNLFSSEVGVTFKEHVTELRISEAKTLLRESGLSVKDVCYEIGFNDPNYFSKLFKKKVGITPKQYSKVKI